ncbi:MAG: PilZ domain-containing protein [Desulfobacterales bacterium]
MNQNENNHSERPKNSSANGLELLKVTRGSFRTPVSGAGTATVQINDQLFDVENIAPRGIGIRVAHADMFFVNQKIDSVQLILEGNSFHLKGRVVHISPDGAGKFLCGIEFVDMDRESEEKLLDYLKKSRTELFTKHEED